MWYAEKALSLPPVTMGTGNLVNLEKTSEMFPIKDKLLASYSLAKNWKNSAIKLSIEGSVLLIFVNSSQIFSEGLLVIAINKVQSFNLT